MISRERKVLQIMFLFIINPIIIDVQCYFKKRHLQDDRKNLFDIYKMISTGVNIMAEVGVILLVGLI